MDIQTKFLGYIQSNYSTYKHVLRGDELSVLVKHNNRYIVFMVNRENDIICINMLFYLDVFQSDYCMFEICLRVNKDRSDSGMPGQRPREFYSYESKEYSCRINNTERSNNNGWEEIEELDKVSLYRLELAKCYRNDVIEFVKSIVME